MFRIVCSFLAVLMMVFSLTACTRTTAGLGGAAIGAAGAGAGYEYQAKRQMDQLKEDREEGRITQEEYEIRKKQIERGSIIY
jgi:hypothetical protein